MPKNKKILFLTLYTFSLTGGIEKVCKALCKTFSLLTEEENLKTFQTFSLHDQNAPDERYINKKNFNGFAGTKIAFVIAALKEGYRSDFVILSHINLLIFAKIFKKIAPNIRVILIAHGIEVWTKLKPWKVKFLQQQVEVWAVSNFTATKLNEIHGIPNAKIKVVNNCLDPFFNIPTSFSKPAHLLKKYGLKQNDKVIFSLARLSSAEQYKGYDKVLEAMKDLPKDFYYILSGKADNEEKERILKLIENYGLAKRAILTVFLHDDELTDHYLLADAFAMPSTGEGFGISFIEAAACGCPSVAGILDGSSDALLNGELGKLINPNNLGEIQIAIKNTLTEEKAKSSALLQKKCLEHFGFEQYKEKIFALISEKELTSVTPEPAF